MHNGSPERSKRLKLALDYLEVCGSQGCTTAQLQAQTHSMAPATDCSELRRSGYLIDCDCLGTWNGRRVYRYTLRGRRFE